MGNIGVEQSFDRLSAKELSRDSKCQSQRVLSPPSPVKREDLKEDKEPPLSKMEMRGKNFILHQISQQDDTRRSWHQGPSDANLLHASGDSQEREIIIETVTDRKARNDHFISREVDCHQEPELTQPTRNVTPTVPSHEPV